MPDLWFTMRDGVRIAADAAGDEGAPSVLFLHGGGQTRHSWGRAVRALGEAGFRAITADLRGHGESDWSPDGDYAIEAFAEDIRTIAATLPDLPVLVGASLGGLSSMVAIGQNEEPVARGLVMVDITHRPEPEGGAEIRNFMTGNPHGFASLEEAADAVAAYLPHRKRPADTSGLRKNLRQREDGRYYWHWDPGLMQGHRNISGLERLEHAASALTLPVLLVRGGSSRVVSPAGVEAFRALVPQTEYVNIADADHMVAGDANDDFTPPLREFLERTR